MIYFSTVARCLRFVLALTCLLVIQAFCPAIVSAESEEEAYSRVIAERAAKITESMSFSDHEQEARVQQLIANQYRALRDIHAKRDADKENQSAVVTARLEMFEAHNRFVSLLSAELTCDQVDRIKDGLTYGVLNHTYNGYLTKLPDLKEAEKRTIKAYLLEARELAMDGGSADEKHEIFRKFKGKINNYLSAAGYTL